MRFEAAYRGLHVIVHVPNSENFHPDIATLLTTRLEAVGEMRAALGMPARPTAPPRPGKPLACADVEPLITPVFAKLIWTLIDHGHLQRGPGGIRVDLAGWPKDAQPNLLLELPARGRLSAPYCWWWSL